MPATRTPHENYQLISDIDSDTAAMTFIHFLIQLAGNTAGAHLDIVKKLKGIGQIQVNTPEESDYVLLFCPIVSRIGKDISEALAEVPGDKPIILVLMYHTFRPDNLIPDVTRWVVNPNVRLFVTCLLYNGKLLKCNQNEIAWFDIQRFFRVSTPQISSLRAFANWVSNNRKLVCVCICISVSVVSVVVVIFFTLNKK